MSLSTSSLSLSSPALKTLEFGTRPKGAISFTLKIIHDSIYG